MLPCRGALLNRSPGAPPGRTTAVGPRAERPRRAPRGARIDCGAGGPGVAGRPRVFDSSGGPGGPVSRGAPAAPGRPDPDGSRLGPGDVRSRPGVRRADGGRPVPVVCRERPAARVPSRWARCTAVHRRRCRSLGRPAARVPGR